MADYGKDYGRERECGEQLHNFGVKDECKQFFTILSRNALELKADIEVWKDEGT